jgi:hypothetical protein
MGVLLARDPEAPEQQCEATGKKDATLWRLTFPPTPPILVGMDALEAGPR